MKVPGIQTRRQFFRAGIRHALLGGMIGLAVVGESKRRRLAGNPNCLQLPTCAECLELSRCGRKRAHDFRSKSAQSGSGG